jgi:hypothetical protein
VVDDEPTWKVDEVPQLINYQRAKLQELITSPIGRLQDLEAWETDDLLEENWDQQLQSVQQRAREADALWEKLLDRWTEVQRQRR